MEPALQELPLGELLEPGWLAQRLRGVEPQEQASELPRGAEVLQALPSQGQPEPEPGQRVQELQVFR